MAPKAKPKAKPKPAAKAAAKARVEGRRAVAHSVACGEVSADPEGQQEAEPAWCEAQPAAWEPWEELWGSQASVLQADRPFPAEEAWA